MAAWVVECWATHVVLKVGANGWLDLLNVYREAGVAEEFPEAIARDVIGWILYPTRLHGIGKGKNVKLLLREAGHS